MTVAMKEKYFIALYEILFHLLDVTVEKKGLFKPYLLPIIAHLLMKLSIGMDRKPSTDWVFWKMAKVSPLGVFFFLRTDNILIRKCPGLTIISNEENPFRI